MKLPSREGILEKPLILFFAWNRIAFVLRLREYILSLGSGRGMSSVEILYLIENLREKLNIITQNKSLIDPEVVQLSQSLDTFLNLYHNTEVL